MGDEEKKNMEEGYWHKKLGIWHKNQGTVSKWDEKRDQIIL